MFLFNNPNPRPNTPQVNIVDLNISCQYELIFKDSYGQILSVSGWI